MHIHQSLGRKVRYDSRDQSGFLKQCAFIGFLILDRRCKCAFILVALLQVLFEHPVILLVNRPIEETQRRCLAKAGAADKHHIDGWTCPPVALDLYLAGIPDSRCHS